MPESFNFNPDPIGDHTAGKESPAYVGKSAAALAGHVLDPLPQAQREANAIHEHEQDAALAAAIAARAAKNKLAQDALASDPAVIRKAFPKLTADLHERDPLNRTFDELSLSDINTFLKDIPLPEDDRNLLAVLRSGFSVLSSGNLSFTEEYKSSEWKDKTVSDRSLEVADKAVHRDLDTNPLFRADIGLGAKKALAGGIVCGASTYAIYRDRNDALYAGATYATAASIYYGCKAFKNEDGDRQNQIYDHVKNDFLTFSNSFKNARGTAGGEHSKDGGKH